MKKLQLYYKMYINAYVTWGLLPIFKFNAPFSRRYKDFLLGDVIATFLVTRCETT